MPSDIQVESPDWRVMPEPPKNCECAWTNNEGLVVALNHFGMDKGLRDRMSDVTGVRNHYRAGFAKQGMGLIECDVFDLEGAQAVRAIAKILLQPHGAAYAGTIALPLPKESYVLNIVAREVGITGMRETAVMLKVGTELEKQGFTLDLPADENSKPNNAPINWRNASTGVVLPWNQDPYDAKIDGPCLRNMADGPEHDVGFPQHPLSLVRLALQSLREGLKFSPALKRRAAERRRWRLW